MQTNISASKEFLEATPHTAEHNDLPQIDILLSERNAYAYGKVMVLQFFAIAAAAFLSFFFKPLLILKVLASIGGSLGFVGVYFAHYFKDRAIKDILKNHTLAQSCFLQRSSHNPEKNYFLGLLKMAELRKKQTHVEFITTLEAALEELIKTPTTDAQTLEIFYQTVVSYNHHSFLSRMNPFRKATPETLPSTFWAKIYCKAATLDHSELMQTIQWDRLKANRTMNPPEDFVKDITVLTQKYEQYNHVPIPPEIEPLKSPIYTLQQKINLLFISLSRLLGNDLILSIADIKIYLIKNLIIANQIPLSMGAAATSTFLGFTLSSLTPLLLGTIALGAVTYGLRKASRWSIANQIQNQTLTELIFIYHNSQDERWMSMIHLKITMFIQDLSKNISAFTLCTPTAFKQLNTLERQSFFFAISNYIDTHTGQIALFSRANLSHDQLLKIQAHLTELSANLENADDKQSFDQMIENFLPDVSNTEQFKKLEDATWYLKWRENLSELIFPVATTLNFILSSTALLVPLSILAISCFITLIPAACIIVAGISFYFFSKKLEHDLDKTIAYIDLQFLLSQSESPGFSRIFDKKIKHMIQNIPHEQLTKIMDTLSNPDRPAIKLGMQKYYDIALRALKAHINPQISSHTGSLHAKTSVMPTGHSNIGSSAASLLTSAHEQKKLVATAGKGRQGGK